MKMMLCVLIAVLTAGALPAPPAAAQHGAFMPMPRLDVAAPVTYHGVIARVFEGGHGMGRGTMRRTFIVLDTGDERIAVHLGPATYLEEQHVAVKVGETVDVVGWRVARMRGPVVIVRELTVGGVTVTLRDETGRPTWSVLAGGEWCCAH
jgi:hypothetical protein